MRKLIWYGNIEKNIEIISIFISKLVVSFLSQCHMVPTVTLAFIFFLKKYVPTLCRDLFTMKKAKMKEEVSISIE